MDLQAMLMRQMGGASEGMNMPLADTSETIHISSLALIKMLKHGRAGVPLEVMGLMLGEFVDEYTITVKDVFAMPQSGTGVSVEAVDPVFQTDMLDMLKHTGRKEMVVGWYHSHPGFGCWLSSVDVETQMSFEATNPRCVAVVVDPIQSVKGKVVIDCFRSIDKKRMLMSGTESRQVTSNIGHIHKPTLQALIHGLNRQYYDLVISYRKDALEQKMLQNVHKPGWSKGLELEDYDRIDERNKQQLKTLLDYLQKYNQALIDQRGKSLESFELDQVGKINPKKHIAEASLSLLSLNGNQLLGTMVNQQAFAAHCQ